MLEEEHDVSNPIVECIQREVQGADWECRAHTAEGEYHCEVKTHPHEKVIHEHASASARRHGERGEDETSTTEHDEPGGETSETETVEEH